MKLRQLLLPCLSVTLFCALLSCNLDKAVNYIQGEGRLQLDLSALSNDTAQRVFVTIADLRLDGRSLPGFQRTTLELTGLDNEQVVNLYNGLVDSREYEMIEMLLDPTTDERGNGPGCYVIDAAGTKRMLEVPGEGLLRIPARTLSVDRSGFAQGTVHFDLSRAIHASNSEQITYQIRANRWNDDTVQFVSNQLTATSQPLPSGS